MCGITGYYAFTNNSAANLTKITDSTEKLILRGPDSGGTFCNDNIALGHRRLSILDTSSNGQQPMIDKSGRFRIVFNGEIFNYVELYNKYLAEKVPHLQSSSDTEVLLYLLIEYGAQCLPWLSGFFAFAFYSDDTGDILIARDRYGKKPLYYYHTSEYLAFASEMKSLLAYGIPKELDYTVLHQYLQLNYIPQPFSIFKGCKRLVGGHYMTVNRHGDINISQYYDLKIQKDKYGDDTYEQAQQKVIDLLDQSVQERLIADVPLGAFLSGGIDSSVIVALATRHTNKLNTFSIGYKNNPFFDETSYAKLVADKYNTNHTVFSLANDDFLAHVYNVLDYFDEPFADSSAIPTYILCQETRKYVTVALSGDGADEMFSGYNKHAAEYKVRQQSLVNSVVKAGLPIWSMMPRSRGGKVTNLFRQLHRFAEGASMSTKERYWRWASINTANDAAKLLSKDSRTKIDMQAEEKYKDQILSAIQTDDMNEVLLTDMNLVLTGDMLVKVDMMSMANSLEVRSPFLDYKVVDYVFSIPPQYKVDGSMKKKILQDAFRPMLPAELYNRPKHGFEIPLLGWLRNELWGLINDDLLSDTFVAQQGVFDVKAISNLKQKLKSNNPADSHATIWALIVFQYWWKKYYL
ncbi:MAG: asparagine synthase (glutamine-hydrolyzing) [Sphingobacteriales bacterium]|nr:MAG: asparagine synthase (glutamine-hydrolyzing) [Sphingobacteriales bacterium]